jgi:uncharacterized protein (DUF1697 family)
MRTYVILLRAVNLAGHGKLAMADFRKLLAKFGFENVETYIQSGNAVVDAKGTAADVAKAVAAGLEKLTGAPAGVVVRSHEELDRVLRENPFHVEAADGSKVHVAFLDRAPAKDAVAGLERIVTQYPKRRDRYKLIADALYLHLPDGAAETKFTGKLLDKALGGVMGTARNWNTVVKLHAMSKR